MTATPDHARTAVAAIEATFRAQKSLGEKALAQTSDAALHTPLSPDTSSVAVITRHMSGNLLSRFTDFLTTDGEKTWRDRDREFIGDHAPREEVVRRWEQGWTCLFAALDTLNDTDLGRTVTIRSEPHTVALALARALAHQSYHVGQIVQTCRVHAQGRAWQTLTIPRGGSDNFNAKMGHTAESPSPALRV
ncbi:MAG: DUF1572 family protein [Planctomycetes bacterium]|nr:DUF1572 family protein [Planctomycetota bacterium]